MVIIKLQGGLGNQMFQYALGRKIEIKKGKEIQYDFSYFNHAGSWPFELDIFGLTLNGVKSLGVLKLPPTGNGMLNKLKAFYQRFFPVKLISQTTFAFDNRFLNTTDSAYLEGYWQTEEYFKDIRNVLLKDFSFDNSLNMENKEYGNNIRSKNAVSIHFRRGDYVLDTADIFKTFEWSYYMGAIKIMADRLENPFFYIFSDDPEWCKQNVKLDQPFEIVEINKQYNNHLDMYFMSQCRHNIIANSSFSWWAAWLNKNEEKIVVAPKNWFADKTIDTKDIIPKSWVSI